MTGQQIIDYAKQFKGQHSAIFADWYGISRSSAWCAVFVSYILNHCGVNYPKNAWVPNADAQLSKLGKWVGLGDAQAGDVVIFTWHGGGYNSGKGSRDHIGFIQHRNSDGSFLTIEGNTSGSIVAERTRYPINIYKIYRLNSLGGSSYTYTPSASSSSTPAYNSSAGYAVNEGVRYTTSSLNVRTGPSTSYGIVQTLPKGTPIKVVRRYGNWGYSNGARGWVCTDYLSGSTVTKSVARATSGGYSTGMYHVGNGQLNVRTGPGTGYNRVQTLASGTPLRILKVSGVWGYSAGARGWVHLGYCRKG